MEDTFSLLTSTPSFTPFDLEAAQNVISNATPSQYAELTADEQLLLTGWEILRSLILRITLHQTADKNLDVCLTLQKLKEFLELNLRGSTLPEPSSSLLPSSENVQKMFLRLTFLKACAKLCSLTLSFLKQKSHELKEKIKNEEVQSLADLMKDISEGIYDLARNWRTELKGESADGLMDEVGEGQTRGLVESIVGREEVANFVLTCRESAIAALGGVLRVKIV